MVYVQYQVTHHYFECMTFGIEIVTLIIKMLTQNLCRLVATMEVLTVLMVIKLDSYP